MKKIYKSITLIAAILGLSSHGSDWLDRKPADGIPSENAITNYNDALTVRTDMYDGIQGDSNSTGYYGARMFYYGDVRAEDIQVRTQGMRSSSYYGMCYTVDDVPSMWNIPYSVIRRVNRLIQAINEKKVTDATEAQIGKIYSEVLVVGALVHFDLVRVYGMPYTADNGASLGILAILRPLERNNLPSRDTVAGVCTQVIRDLTDAINSGYLTKNKTQGYISKQAAKTLLTRVYLTKGDNESTLKVAEDIVTNSPYKLWTNEEYINTWYKGNGVHANEMIFEAIDASNDDWTDRSGIAYLLSKDGYADVIATKNFMAVLSQDPKDVRIGMVLPTQYDKGLKEEYGDAKISINKFPADKDDVDEIRLDSLPLLRLSGIYLSAAEAAAKPGGHQDKAAKYLNGIVLRANPKAGAVSETDATVGRIILERRKEMIGEGRRYFDALRNSETIVRYEDGADKGYHYSLIKESQSFDRTCFGAILPTPVDETSVGPDLRAQQNPGY